MLLFEQVKRDFRHVPKFEFPAMGYCDSYWSSRTAMLIFKIVLESKFYKGSTANYPEQLFTMIIKGQFESQ